MTIVVLFLLGLALGSFVNALVWRVHEQAKPKAKQAKADLSITKGRSVCTYCQHQLSSRDLIPVVSWLWLHGKCRYCHKSIGWQYPVVELVTAGLFIMSYLLWPYELNAVGIFQLATWLAILTGLVTLFVYDLKWMLLPDRIVFPVIVLTTTQVVVVALWQQDVRLLVSAILGAASLFGLFYVLFQVSNGKWIGGGDVKLVAALGMLAGSPIKAFLLLFIAACLGTIYSTPLLMSGKKRATQHVAFGPFLIMATIIVYLFGTSLIDWYEKQVLLL